MSRRSVLLCLGILAMLGSAQGQWGIHVVLPRIERVFADPNDNEPLPPMDRYSFSVGLGFDVDLSPYTSMGMDFTFRTDAFEGGVHELEKSTGYYHFSYNETMFVPSIIYYSSYFFAGNREASPYIGPFLGARFLSRDLSGGEGEYAPDKPVVRNTEGQAWVVPLGLRLGARGDLRHAFADFHVMLGYQIGGGKPMFPEPYLKDFGSAGFIYGFGLSIGGGTDGKKGAK